MTLTKKADRIQSTPSPLLQRALSCQAAAGADAGSPLRPVKRGRASGTGRPSGPEGLWSFLL